MSDDPGAPSGSAGHESQEETAYTPVSDSAARAAAAKVRFTPGSMLSGRYRIVALLGRGGMGEVYRAEDVKLGQGVALKFLPRELAGDREKLQRLYAEVRLGRQVSHPNVCRLYDVGEWDGHHFLSMEYIDGEDLASLLRRIGKLPHEKALEIARDLCAGLAAAHGLGIVHRDLKPANVMIDGRGDARLTDFGLAVLAEGGGPRGEIAGTPAYMAPEQLDGDAITPKTDLYALGLILYEIFTGKRLYEGNTFNEIAAQRKTSSSQSLSRETGGLDPAVQRVILRCLEADPAKRPASIHAVIASLPGGDPLQAALDAGETPSPEMVAAAGSVGELAPKVAWPLFLGTVLLLVAAAAISSRLWWSEAGVNLPKDPGELAFQAREILTKAGVTGEPADSVRGFEMDPDFRAWLRKLKGPVPKGMSLGPAIFGYRESPRPMVTALPGELDAFGSDPAFTVPDMTQVILEPDGRLRELILVPPQELDPSSATPDWKLFFAEAGLDPGKANEVPPKWRPPIGADRRFAWTIPMAGFADPVRVEAASLSGRPVWFEVIAPWKAPITAGTHQESALERLSTIIVIGSVLLLLGVGAVLANRNLRRGRGDRQGAWRVAAILTPFQLANFALSRHFYRAALPELSAIFLMLALALFFGLTVWVWYLALEPYLRRRWPRTLISWNRLLHGQWKDPLVGRDVLIGVFAYAGATLVRELEVASSRLLGGTPPLMSNLWDLGGWRYVLASLFDSPFSAVIVSLLFLMVLLFMHLLFRRRAVAIAITFGIVMLTFGGSPTPLEWVSRAVFAAVFTWVMVRYGMVALSALLVALTAGGLVETLDPSKWFFGQSFVVLLLLIGLAAFGFFRSLGSHALFSVPVLED